MSDEFAKAAGKSAATAITIFLVCAVPVAAIVIALVWLGKRSDIQGIALSGVLFVVSAALTAISVGLRRGRRWARVAGIYAGFFSLFAFPIGTVFGGFVLFKLVFCWSEPEVP